MQCPFTKFMHLARFLSSLLVGIKWIAVAFIMKKNSYIADSRNGAIDDLYQKSVHFSKLKLSTVAPATWFLIALTSSIYYYNNNFFVPAYIVIIQINTHNIYYHYAGSSAKPILCATLAVTVTILAMATITLVLLCKLKICKLRKLKGYTLQLSRDDNGENERGNNMISWDHSPC